MILIRKVKNLSLRQNLLHSLFPRQAPYTLTTTSPSSMPIDKILKAASRKKCNTVQDVMFCAMVFGLLTSTTSTPKQHADMTNEVSRMITGSLDYISQLSLPETLMFTNNCLGLLNAKKINIDPEMMTSLIHEINKKIEIGVERDIEGKHVREIIEYMKRLILFKKVDFGEGIINYLTAKPKNEEQVIEAINVLCSLKSKNKLYLQKSIQKLLESEIGSKIDKLPMESKLIDESVLKIFFEYSFQVKQPYNCIPQWLFLFVQKLRDKYTSPSQHISAIKKISFFRYYRKMLTSSILISECYVTEEMLQFLPDYFRKLSQLFDYFDEEPMENKVDAFFSSFEHYSRFFQLYPNYETDEAVADLCDSMRKIYDRYFGQVRLRQLNPQQEVRILDIATKYSLVVEFLLSRYKDNEILTSVLPKILHKLIQIYKFSFNRQASPQKFASIAPLLPFIAKLSQHPAVKYSDKADAISLVEGFIEAIEGLSKIKILEYYTRENVDFVSICYFTSKYLNVRIGENLNELFREIRKRSLMTVIETLVNCILIREEPLKLQLMSLCGSLKSRMENFSKEDGQREVQKKSNGVSFKFYENELMASLILTFKVEFKDMQLDSNLVRYWFRDNKNVIRKLVSSGGGVFENCWTTLRTSLRYLSYLTQQSGIDILSEVVRLIHSQDQKQLDLSHKYPALFNDRRMYQILWTKTDEFASLKYCWNMDYLVGCVTRVGKINEEYQQVERGKGRKKLQEDNGNERLSFYKLIELLSFCASDLKEPLQFSTYRSESICKLLNDSLGTIVKIVESNKRGDKAEDDRNKQQLICSLPMEQIIYFLSQQNRLHPNSWVSDLSPQYLLSFMSAKYSKIGQYNILLSFDPTHEINKKLHHQLISQEIADSHPEIQLMSESDIYIRPLKSTVLKYFFYFLKPGRPQSCIDQCVKQVGSHKMLSSEEVVSYWTSRQVIMRTTHDKLVEAALSRLIGLNSKITYAQFKTALSAILTLFKSNRLQNFHKLDEHKKQTLAQWVYAKFSEFTEINFNPFLIDYFILSTYFPGLSAQQGRISAAIDQNFRNNNISILEQIFQSRYKLSQGNIEELKKLLIRARSRCLTQNYFDVPSNVEFRVQFLLKIVWGVASAQNPQTVSWMWENFLGQVDSYGIRQYLIASENRELLYCLIMRYRLCQQKMPACQVKQLLAALTSEFEVEMQQKISEVQQKRAASLKKQCSPRSGGNGTGVKLCKDWINENKFIYFIQKDNPGPEQYIEASYICFLQKVELNFRPIS